MNGVDESSSQAVRNAIAGRVAWLLSGLDDYSIRDVVLDDIIADANILAECFAKEDYYRHLRRRKAIPHRAPVLHVPNSVDGSS